jgi:hypothetical protein
MWLASRRELGFDEWSGSREEVSVSKIRFARAVTNEEVAAVPQDPPAFRRDRGGIGTMMKSYRHENQPATLPKKILVPISALLVFSRRAPNWRHRSAGIERKSVA